MIEGKHDEAGAPLLPSHGNLSSNQIALAIAAACSSASTTASLRAWLEAPGGARRRRLRPGHAAAALFLPRLPAQQLDPRARGLKALAGIGCHFMVQWMDRDTRRFTQMGGEGGSWLGEAPFSTREHIFQNVGDGTFYHSGSLAIRAAVASGANITFKILYNDAVAMTGGQKMETGNLDVPATRLLELGGRQGDRGRHRRARQARPAAGFAPGVRVHHRDELDAVQRRLREVPGVSALVFDQTCAAEKRRRRKRGAFPDPDERVVINELVCEGLRRLRAGQQLRRHPAAGDRARPQAPDRPVGLQQGLLLPQGLLPQLRHRQGRTAAQGRGPDAGAAVPGPARARAARARRPLRHRRHRRRRHRRRTVAALLGMAAHLEGKGIAALDMIGLAQKGGAVLSHLKMAPTQEEIGAPRGPPAARG